MIFKNNFGKKCYEICLNSFSEDRISIDHNSTLKTEKTIVSFTGNPKKDIDVITLDFTNDTKLLISCKDFESNVPPSAIQEWGDVIKVLNKYSIASKYIGIVISSKGFSEGCEAWAKTDNLGLIPPYRGDKNHYTEDIVSFFTLIDPPAFLTY